MNENPDVSAWLAELDHPLEDVTLAVRTVFLEADDRISETIKWKSPTFMYEGNLASIDPKARKHVAVLFRRGAGIPGDHPLLETRASWLATPASRIWTWSRAGAWSWPQWPGSGTTTGRRHE